MKKVLISGYYGFDNTGDEAILEALTNELKNSNFQVGVLSKTPIKTANRYKIKAYRRFNIGDIFKAVSECDCLISGGGSLFQDITSSTSLFYYLSIIIIARLLKKEIFVYAQGIGPITKKLNQKIFKFIIEKVDWISVRDQISIDELKLLNIKPKNQVFLTSDAVFLLQPAKKQFAQDILQNLGVDFDKTKLLIGMGLRNWKDNPQNIETFAKIADNLVNEYGASIVFFAFHGQSDLAFATEIMNKMTQKAYIIDTEKFLPSEVMALMGMMHINIGVRLHSLIFSAAMGIPMLGINYDPKVEGFLNTFGLTSVSTYQNLSWDAIKKALSDFLENQKTYIEKIEIKTIESRNLAKQTFNTLLERRRI